MLLLIMYKWIPWIIIIIMITTLTKRFYVLLWNELYISCKKQRQNN